VTIRLYSRYCADMNVKLINQVEYKTFVVLKLLIVTNLSLNFMNIIIVQIDFSLFIMNSKFDEDTHLAIALSVSDTSVADFQPENGDNDETHMAYASRQQDLFSFMVSSKSSDKSDLINKKKRKKKMQ